MDLRANQFHGFLKFLEVHKIHRQKPRLLSMSHNDLKGKVFFYPTNSYCWLYARYNDGYGKWGKKEQTWCYLLGFFTQIGEMDNIKVSQQRNS